MKTRASIYMAIALALALSLIVLIFNIDKLYHQCLGVIDYSIYQQAISELSLMKAWNPYVMIRDIYIFNEHFDPVIFLAVPFFKLLNFSPYSLVVFEWAWFLIFAVSCLKFSRAENTKQFLLILALLFGLRPILSGLAFVGHPVTWAIVPLFFLVKGLYEDKYKLVLVSSLCLVFFKETFAFGVFALSFFYLIRRERRTFLFLFLLGLFFILFEMKFRKLLFGNTFSYGNSFLVDILNDPIDQTIFLFKNFHYGDFFKVFYPFIIPIVFELRKTVLSKKLRSPFIGVILFLLPLLVIHFIINRYTFHHASKFSSVLIAVVVFSGFVKEAAKLKKLYPLVLILFLLSGISWHKKIFKLLVLNKSSKCEPFDERGFHREKLLDKFFSSIDEKDEIFVTGGIGPFVIKPNLKIHHSSFSKMPETLDYILLERGVFSDIYPLSMEKVELIRESCIKHPHEVLYEDKYYFFAKGTFPKGCVK